MLGCGALRSRACRWLSGGSTARLLPTRASPVFGGALVRGTRRLLQRQRCLCRPAMASTPSAATIHFRTFSVSVQHSKKAQSAKKAQGEALRQAPVRGHLFTSGVPTMISTAKLRSRRAPVRAAHLPRLPARPRGPCTCRVPTPILLRPDPAEQQGRQPEERAGRWPIASRPVGARHGDSGPWHVRRGHRTRPGPGNLPRQLPR